MLSRVWIELVGGEEGPVEHQRVRDAKTGRDSRCRHEAID